MIKRFFANCFVLTSILHTVKTQLPSVIAKDSINQLQNQNLQTQRIQELNECNMTLNNFQRYWYYDSSYLYKFLSTLKSMNCPQFEQECKRKTYAFSEFTSLMYLKFCNHVELQNKCFSTLKKIVQNHSQQNLSLATWKILKNELENISSINIDELENSCVQIAMFEKRYADHFVEVKNFLVPFCSFTWCGFNEQMFESKKISFWRCMPQR